MPYKSDAQRRYFHWAKDKGLIKEKTVEEFDEASKGEDIPERLHPKPSAKLKKQVGAYIKKRAAQLLESNPKRPQKDLITPEISSGNKKLREGIKVNKDTTDQVKFTKKVKNIPMGVEKIALILKKLLKPQDYQTLLAEKVELDKKRKALLAESVKGDLKKMSSDKLAYCFELGFMDGLQKSAAIGRVYGVLTKAKGMGKTFLQKIKSGVKAGKSIVPSTKPLVGGAKKVVKARPWLPTKPSTGKTLLETSKEKVREAAKVRRAKTLRESFRKTPSTKGGLWERMRRQAN